MFMEKDYLLPSEPSEVESGYIPDGSGCSRPLDEGGRVNFRTWHRKDGLERTLTDLKGNIICDCRGRIVDLNACLAHVQTLEPSVKYNVDVQAASEVARMCVGQGLIHLSKRTEYLEITGEGRKSEERARR